MKLSYTIIVLLLLVLSNGRTMDAQNAREQLFGTWSFDYGSSISKMENRIRSKMDSLPGRRLLVERFYRDRKMKFDPDGTYFLILGNGETSHGIWVLNKNSVQITHPDGNVDSFEIKALDTRMLVLRHRNNGKGRLVLPEWHFIKN